MALGWPRDRIDDDRAAQLPTPLSLSTHASLGDPMPVAPVAQALDTSVAFTKYRLLLVHGRTPPETHDRLLHTLAERENVNNDYEATDREVRLAQLDGTVRSLLHPADIALFEQLSQSDAQLAKLEEFRGGITHVAPLSETQTLWLTFALLRQGEALRALGDVTSIRFASTQFVLEASALLEPEQLEMLRAYEATELERLLGRLN